MRRRVALAVALLALAAGGAVAGVWAWNERATKDVRGSAETEFVPTEEPGATTRPEKEAREEPWPTYGFDEARTRFAPEFDVRPPFRELWMVRGRTLLEFPPVIAYGRLFFATNEGRFFAVEVKTGNVVWHKHFRRCSAASPTVADGVVYHTFMDPSPCPKGHDEKAGGFVVAMDADSGKELWRVRTGVNESSLLHVDGVLYYGDWRNKVYALDTRTRRHRWTFTTGDRVKGSAAYVDGTVYIAAYDGKVYALDARTGKRRWESEAQGGVRGAGNFYATPAVAYGRVFIGNTDGKVYAFGASSGDLIWSHGTEGYVYSSAAVWERTVYVGSYDGNLYALDAATGEERWSFDAGGPISGSPTVLAGVVYVSTLEQRTFAVDARSGKRLWDFRDGKYSPLVSDGERVYLTGYTRVYGLAPGR